METNLFGYYWQILCRAYSDTVAWANLRAGFVALLTALICLAIHYALLRWRPSLEGRLGNPMDTWWVWVVYSVVPAAIFAIVMGMVNLVMAPVRIHHEQANQIAKLKPSHKLDLYFHPEFFGAGNDNIQYGNVTITNRSKRTMNLSFSGNIHFTDKAKQKRRLMLRGEMDVRGLTKGTGGVQLSLPSEGSELSSLIFFLPKASDYGIDEWKIDPSQDVIIHAFDSVTGIHEYFRASPGYPSGRVEGLPAVNTEQAVLEMQVQVVEDDEKR